MWDLGLLSFIAIYFQYLKKKYSNHSQIFCAAEEEEILQTQSTRERSPSSFLISIMLVFLVNIIRQEVKDIIWNIRSRIFFFLGYMTVYSSKSGGIFTKNLIELRSDIYQVARYKTYTQK